MISRGEENWNIVVLWQGYDTVVFRLQNGVGELKFIRCCWPGSPGAYGFLTDERVLK